MVAIANKNIFRIHCSSLFFHLSGTHSVLIVLDIVVEIPIASVHTVDVLYVVVGIVVGIGVGIVIGVS